MATQHETLTFERTVHTSPSEAFHAFTHPTALRDWLCNAAEVDPRAGGCVYLWWNGGYYSAGVFTELRRDENLAFTWRGPEDPAASEVRVGFAPHDGKTTISLTHGGLGSDEGWAEAIKQIRRGWEVGLENLQSLLETGIDLRLARRPMLGISGGGELDAERAARLGVPVTEGLWLDGFIDGMG